jgi:hypothetical protein
VISGGVQSSFWDGKRTEQLTSPGSSHRFQGDVNVSRHEVLLQEDVSERSDGEQHAGTLTGVAQSAGVPSHRVRLLLPGGSVCLRRSRTFAAHTGGFVGSHWLYAMCFLAARSQYVIGAAVHAVSRV